MPKDRSWEMKQEARDIEEVKQELFRLQEVWHRVLE